MNKTYLSILWHQHQPAYGLTGERVLAMPWVRLHAIKDYVGMALLARARPDFHHTINLVPVLLEQIEGYADGRLSDRDLELLRLPAGDLSERDAMLVLDRLFRANPDTMIRPVARYKELYDRRRVGTATARQALVDFGVADLRDLQVWSVLAWFHPLVVREHGELKALIAKGQGFSEDDKEALLAAQQEVIAGVLPLHRELADAGVVELTTSPRYHPVFPLLCDPSVGAGDDVEVQLADAVASHTARFGSAPRGLWPPEGAVCPATAEMAARLGFEWMASDEGVLAASTGLKAGDRPGARRLYGAYDVACGEGAKLRMIFRDRRLSDRVGFHYPHVAGGAAAAQDLLAQLHALPLDECAGPPLVSIIMDGENAWEFYQGQGVEFLSEFYRLACEDESIEPVTVSEYLDRFGSIGRIERLHRGSWIGADLGMWVGRDEQDAAWDLLKLARASVETASATLPEAGRREARDCLHRAEGSDWFWWYGRRAAHGDPAEFDALFRGHLRRACELAGVRAPEALQWPLTRHRASVTPPGNAMHVLLDGRATSFYEWLGAGHYDADADMGPMMVAGGPAARHVYFGFGAGRFLLRIDAEAGAADPTPQWGARIAFSNGLVATVTGRGECGPQAVVIAQRDGRAHEQHGEGAAWRSEVLELSIPLAALGLGPCESIEFYVELIQDGAVIQRLPSISAIGITCPPEGEDADDWVV